MFDTCVSGLNFHINVKEIGIGSGGNVILVK